MREKLSAENARKQITWKRLILVLFVLGTAVAAAVATGQDITVNIGGESIVIDAPNTSNTSNTSNAFNASGNGSFDPVNESAACMTTNSTNTSTNTSTCPA